MNTSNDKLLVIAASEGGPPIVHAVLSQLGSEFTVPIVVCQVFESDAVQPLVNAWDRTSRLKVQEVREDTNLDSGIAHVIPYQCRVKVKHGGNHSILSLCKGIDECDAEGHDLCDFLNSASQAFGSGLWLVIAGSMQPRFEVLRPGIEAVRENSGLVRCIQDTRSEVSIAANTQICEQAGIGFVTTDGFIADLYEWTGKSKRAEYPAW